MGDETTFFKAVNRGKKAALLRGGLWMGIAMATDFRHSWSEMRQHGTVDWFSIVDASTGCLLAGLIALRLYIDQSYARLWGLPPGTNGPAEPGAVPPKPGQGPVQGPVQGPKLENLG